MGAWDFLVQLQFVMFNIFVYKIYKQKQYKKYVYQFRGKKKTAKI